MSLIPKHKDPLGQAVKRFFESGKNDAIIVESNIADDDVIPVEYLFGKQPDLPILERKALGYCEGKILDVGAAAGRHSLILQDMKRDVSALEISELCCEIMKKRGVQKVISEDYFELTNNTYDTLLFLMNGIGIAGTIAGLDAFFEKAKTLLNSGGRIIFDSSDIRFIYEEDDGSTWVDLNNTYHGELEYKMKYDGIESIDFPWLFIDFDTLIPIAQKHGFEAKLLASGEHYDYLGMLYKN